MTRRAAAKRSTPAPTGRRARTRARQASEDRTIYRALAIVESRLREPGPALSNPQAAAAIMRLRLATLEVEHFACLFLDSQHRLIEFEILARGTIDGAAVYPREVVKRALSLNAAAVIIGHNHPSGVTLPSAADRAVTDRLKQALGVVDVRVLDHLVVGRGPAVSFAERGWL